MSEIVRKPVAIKPLTTSTTWFGGSYGGTPTVSGPPMPIPWTKEVEKDAGESQEHFNRTSTEYQLEEPRPAYKKKKGITIFGKEITVNPSTNRATNRLSQRFGQDIGGQKKYLGLSRNTFFGFLAAFILVLIGVIVGLTVGLKGASRTKNLPLPNNKDVHTGDLTYYAPGLGACGVTNSDKDSIVAISHEVFDAAQTGSNPNANPLCGKKLRASRYNEKIGAQRSVDLTVTDRCVGCKPTDIDVTTSVFDQLADRDDGRVVTTWAWLDVDL